MRELWLQIVKTSGSRAYSLLAGLIVLSLTARWLGPAGRGEMAAALVWCNLFFILGFLSLNLVVMSETAGALSGERIGKLLANLLLVTAFVTVAGWATAGAMHLIRPETFGAIRPSVLLIAFAGLPFLIWEQYGNALLLSLGRLDIYNKATIAAKTAVLVLVAALFAMRFGIHAAVAATVAGQAVLAFAGMPVVVREAGPSIRIDTAQLRRMLKAAVRLHPSAVATFISSYAGVLIVNRYLGNSPTGLFQLATQLVDVMLVIPYAANVVLYSRLSRDGIIGVWPFQRRILMGVLALMAFQAATAALLAPWLIPMLAGPQFAEAVPLFRWLLPAVVAASLSAVMTTQWIGRGLFLQISAINVTSVVVNLTLNFTLTPRIGIYGAVIASVASYLLIAVANLLMAIRCENEWKALSTEQG